MTRPLITCFILAGIHAYLGLHVVRRGVIFVDLALAQIAAFGATVGFLFGFSLHSRESFLLSLGFTFLGAALFAISRHREIKVPQEAYIGVVYAIFAAGSILVLSEAPQGGEELKSLMVGHLLFISWEEILKIALIYALVGYLHWVCRERFLLISDDPDRAFAEGRRVRLWDFLFYASFGVVVTSSTEVAGVLLVFSFLVVPAVCGVLLGEGVRARLIIGWGIALLTSIAGILASYYLDLPTGATIVCMFGVALIMALCVSLTKIKWGRDS